MIAPSIEEATRFQSTQFGTKLLPFDQTQYTETTGFEERTTIVNKNIVNSRLRNRPTELQCQFCRKHVTTKLEMSKFKDEMTADLRKSFQRTKRWMKITCIFPLFWNMVFCLYAAIKHTENSAIAYHQCPNCNNWIGISGKVNHPGQYSTVSGSKEDQVSELRKKFFAQMPENGILM